jgi:hypothetical protein
MKESQFSKGNVVQYRNQIGQVYFVCHEYITICLNPEAPKAKHICILVHPSKWNQVILCNTSNNPSNCISQDS